MLLQKKYTDGPPAPDAVVAAAARACGVPYSDLVGRRRYKSIARARHVAAYALRERLGMSLCEVGAALGRRDHKTIILSLRAVASRPDLLAVARRLVVDLGGVASGGVGSPSSTEPAAEPFVLPDGARVA